MANAVKQEVSANSGSSSTTMALTLPGAPTSGNLLVLWMAGDKNTGALTLTGFTQQHQILGASTSLYCYWKVSDGTETTINPSWATSSAAGNTAWYAELEDTAVSGSTWEVAGTASTTYSDSTANARSSNTTGTVTRACLALGGWAVDSSTSVSGARVYSNSYAFEYEATGLGGRGAIFVASKSVASGTTECQFSYTGTADQIAGAVVAFAKVGGETHSGSATLTGGGALSAGATKGARGGLALAGGGTLGATDTTGRAVGVQLTGGGVLAVAARAARSMGVQLSGGGVLTPVHFTARVGELDLTGGGVLTAVGAADAPEQHSGSATLTGGGALSAGAATARVGELDLTGGGVLLSDAATARAGAVLLSGGGVFTATVANSENEVDMGLASTMDALAALAPLDQKYAWPAGSVETPCVVVGYPELSYDFVYGDGRHTATYPVYVLAGRTIERGARAVLDAAIEELPPALTGTLGGVVDSASCTRARLVQITIGVVEYMAARFTVEVIEA